ncbi:MAG: response regulator transcription factor [Bacteroidota bacterium]
MEENNIDIAIAEDQQMFRQSLVTLLNMAPGLRVICEAADGDAMLKFLRGTKQLPNVLILDIGLPLLNGADLCALVTREFPEIKIIMLSVHAQERLIAKLITAGAHAYLNKNCDFSELVTAIDSVYTKGFYMNADTLNALRIKGDSKPAQVKSLNMIPIELTARETDILVMICGEKSSAEIAEKLFISIRTVEGHRNNLLLKTGCKNTAGLVLFAVKHHLFETF